MSRFFCVKFESCTSILHLYGFFGFGKETKSAHDQRTFYIESLKSRISIVYLVPNVSGSRKLRVVGIVVIASNPNSILMVAARIGILLTRAENVRGVSTFGVLLRVTHAVAGLCTRIGMIVSVKKFTS